jgi:enoyl-CoA hydratase/carnithine racemase
MAANAEVGHVIENSSCFVTLTRSKKLNSLTMNMINGLNDVFHNIILKNKVNVIVLEGEGEKAFCAGGDVARVRESGLSDDKSLTYNFFHDEYLLNHIIGTQEYADQISIWDGITMGGGVGISVHGKYRIATEKTLFAKPETAIGFFPDVGGSYFLSKLNGALGPFIGITGWRLNAKDLMYTGIATHYIKSDQINSLKSELASSSVTDKSVVANILDKYATIPGDEVQESSLMKNREIIDKCFSHNTMEEILNALQIENKRTDNVSNNNIFVNKVLKTIAPFSPAAMKQTLMLIQRGEGMELSDCLKMEFNLCQNIVRDTNSDFYEGVRAVLVDKDRKYDWKEGNTLEEVDITTIEKKFQSIGEGSLVITK